MGGQGGDGVTKHTKDILADVLEEAGCIAMSVKARAGYYHDFLSPLDMPCLQLAADLAVVGTPAALAVRDRHLDGEFDASAAESEAWSASPEGHQAMGALMRRRV